MNQEKPLLTEGDRVKRFRECYDRLHLASFEEESAPSRAPQRPIASTSTRNTEDD